MGWDLRTLLSQTLHGVWIYPFSQDMGQGEREERQIWGNSSHRWILWDFPAHGKNPLAVLGAELSLQERICIQLIPSEIPLGTSVLPLEQFGQLQPFPCSPSWNWLWRGWRKLCHRCCSLRLFQIHGDLSWLPQRVWEWETDVDGMRRANVASKGGHTSGMLLPSGEAAGAALTPSRCLGMVS